MSCIRRGITGEIVDRSAPSIVKGSDAYLVVQIVDSSGDPSSFDSLVGATGYFEGADDAIINIPATALSEPLAKLQLDLPASSTSLLESGDEQSFQVDFRDSRGLRKILFDGALMVVDPLYP